MTSREQQRYLGAIAVAVLIGAVGGWRLMRQPTPVVANGKSKPASSPDDCSARVTKAELQKSVEIGGHYMVAHQRPEGNFDYEYDWKAKKNAEDDQSTRQAGAMWGVALLNRFEGPTDASPALRAATVKGIAFYDATSRTTKEGWRYPIYKTEKTGGIGMAALVVLGVIEYIRSLPPGSDEALRLTKRANEYVDFIVGTNRADGLWPGDYRFEDGATLNEHSSYSDGEALLALATAMKYLPRDDLRPVIERAAAAGHKINVDEALAADADSATTKGYYQWSSMAYYELATSKMSTAAPYGEWLMSLADWIIDVHHILDKERNTGYAYEGIVSALAWAKKANDKRAERYTCVIHRGLGKLMSWQVGHPRASALGPDINPAGIGGVQNHALEPGLRIDVVQHQMHATMLAVDYLF